MTLDTNATAVTSDTDPPTMAQLPPSDRGLWWWNRWLTLGANLGVVLGLIILIIEVRQNAALTLAAMETQKNIVLTQIEMSISSPEMSAVWMKSIRTPETLTDSELRMLDAHLVAVMLQWEHMFQMERAGLVSRAVSRQHIENNAPFYFGSRFGKHWWTLQKSGWIGTPLMEVAEPILDSLDENFIQVYFDAMRIQSTSAPVESAAPVRASD